MTILWLNFLFRFLYVSAKQSSSGTRPKVKWKQRLFSHLWSSHNWFDIAYALFLIPSKHNISARETRKLLGFSEYMICYIADCRLHAKRWSIAFQITVTANKYHFITTIRPKRKSVKTLAKDYSNNRKYLEISVCNVWAYNVYPLCFKFNRTSWLQVIFKVMF